MLCNVILIRLLDEILVKTLYYLMLFVYSCYIYIYICGKPETERRNGPVPKYSIPMAKPKRVPKRNIQHWLDVFYLILNGYVMSYPNCK
jgi:hypothetical protein